MRSASLAALLLLVLWISCIIWSIYMHWNISKDTVAWLRRAQVAADPEDMSDYLTKLMEGLDKWDCNGSLIQREHLYSSLICPL